MASGDVHIVKEAHKPLGALLMVTSDDGLALEFASREQAMHAVYETLVEKTVLHIRSA